MCKRISILILFVSFSLHAFLMSAVLYLRHSTRLGPCYREYRGAVEFAFFDDQESVIRTEIEGADLDTFTVLSTSVRDQDCENADLYAKDKNIAYYRDEAIVSVNLASFRDLGGGYARDNLSVFYKGVPVTHADAGTFQQLAYGYAKDRNLLFFQGAKCEQPADIKGFRLFDEYTAGDVDRVYVLDEGALTRIRGARPDTFTLISASDPMARLYRDELNGYLVDIVFEELEPSLGLEQPSWYRITDADISTLRMVGSHYYTADATRVFYKGRCVDGADPASFSVLLRPYAKDRKAVYYEERIVTGARPATTKPVKLGDNYSVSAIDQNAVYYGNIKSMALPLKYQQVDAHYSKDISGVFYRALRVTGADPFTFETVEGDNYDARDSSTFYKEGVALGSELIDELPSQ